MLTALFLDTETTGLDPNTHHVAELAWALVHCNGAHFRIVEAHSVLVDIGPEALAAADAEALRIAGLDAQAVEAFGMSPKAVRGLVSALDGLHLDAVVAWNAPFDVSFLDGIFPPQPPAPEGETPPPPFHRRGVLVDAMRNVPWKDLGASSLGLATVAAEVGGFVNPVPHCALTDVITMVKLVAPRLEAAILDAQAPRVKLILTSTRYEANQTLKAMGFYFEGSDKSWRKVVLASTLDELLVRVGNLGTPRVEPVQ